MMMFTPVAFLLCLLTLVTASPIEKRIVPISKCKTLATGILRSATGHKLSLSSHNVLSFGKKDLHVDFQSCQPNFGHWDGKNSTPVGGHLVVKSTGKCLTIKTPYTSPPFTVTTEPCYYSDDSGQTFSNFIEGNGRKIYFVGNTQKDGSLKFFQSKCKSGFYGVSGSAKNGTALLQCANSKGIVALTL